MHRLIVLFVLASTVVIAQSIYISSRQCEKFRVASANDDTQGVARLLTHGFRASTKCDGIPVISEAAQGGENEIVSLLISKGADVNASDPEGETALMYAAGIGERGAVRLLLRAGADVNAVGNDHETALLFAIRGNHEEIAEDLIAKGADVRAKDHGGATTLMWAVSKNNFTLAATLLQRGADINARDSRGNTALVVATKQNNAGIVKLLRTNGAVESQQTVREREGMGRARAIVIDIGDNVYFSSRHRIIRVEKDGTFTTIAGTSEGGYSGDGEPAIKAKLDLSFEGTVGGLAFDKANNLYIPDYSNARVRKVSSDGIITTVAGNGTEGYSGDRGPAIRAQLKVPYAVAVDSAGNLYIADEKNIRKVSPAGIIATVVKETSANSLAVDDAGDLYFAEIGEHTIRKLSPDASSRQWPETARKVTLETGDPP
jgi:ankyrin repeat protein